MASLSDPIAEVAGILLTLSLTPDIDGQILCLKENFAVIQERNQQLNNDLNLKNIEINNKNIEIDGLHEQVEKLEAEKTGWEEKFSKTESARKYDEVCADLDSKNTKLKELEKQVSKLEVDKEILKEQVETLETEVKELKKELQKVKRKNDGEMEKLRGALQDLKTENRTLKKNELLSATERGTLQMDMDDMKKSNSSLEKSCFSLKQSVHDLRKNNISIRQSVDDLKKDNTSLKQNVHDLKTNNKFLEWKVEDLERNFRGSEEQLILGELCRCVQSMIFEKLLPSKLYDVKEIYMIKNMDQHFERAFNYNECEVKAAMQDWAELQKELKLQERDVRTMKFVMKKLQTTRNVVAHPELTEDSLIKATERMNNAGLLGDNRMPGDIMRIINVWKQLKMMP